LHGGSVDWQNQSLSIRIKSSVDYDAKNCRCQYNSENHLVNIKFFHKKPRMIWINLLRPIQMRCEEPEPQARYIFLR
jgi:hypothetical protein